MVITFPFKELKSGSGLPVFRGKVIVARAILETKNNNNLLIRDLLFSIREIESYNTSTVFNI